MYHSAKRTIQTSPIKVRNLFPTYLPHLPSIPSNSYWASTCLTVLPDIPSLICDFCPSDQRFHLASFRFHLTMDTLAIGCKFPTIRALYGLAPIRLRPCWGNKNPHKQRVYDICGVLYITRIRRFLLQLPHLLWLADFLLNPPYYMVLAPFLYNQQGKRHISIPLLNNKPCDNLQIPFHISTFSI